MYSGLRSIWIAAEFSRDKVGGDHLRILVIHSNAQLYGADRMVLESVTAFCEAGWETRVILPYDGPIKVHLESVGADVVCVANPILRRAHMSLRGSFRYTVETLRAMPRLVSTVRKFEPDAVYVNTLSIPLWIFAARLARVPTVCHVHEAEDDAPRIFRVAVVSPLLFVQSILAISEASKSSIVASLPRLASRVHVIYNGVPGPTKDSKPPRDVLSGTVKLVLVGRISAKKGTDVAVEALKILVGQGRDVVLDIVGGSFPGYEHYQRQVRDLVKARQLEMHVNWRGEIPDPWSALEQADIALVPSRAEPFGNAAVEAMLARRPVVVSNTQGLREIIDGTTNGELAEPGEAAQLAAAVGRLIDDWPRAVRQADVAACDAADRFAPVRYRSSVVLLVTSMVSSKAGSATSVGSQSAATGT
jgi:glycosyltransferase involved in cell wall biosynthesis